MSIGLKAVEITGDVMKIDTKITVVHLFYMIFIVLMPSKVTIYFPSLCYCPPWWLAHFSIRNTAFSNIQSNASYTSHKLSEKKSTIWNVFEYLIASSKSIWANYHNESSELKMLWMLFWLWPHFSNINLRQKFCYEWRLSTSRWMHW